METIRIFRLFAFLLLMSYPLGAVPIGNLSAYHAEILIDESSNPIPTLTPRALELTKKGAKAGYSQSNFVLGVMYYNGTDGIEKDFNQAFRYFKIAAEKGQLDSQYILGGMYINAEGTPVNFEQGVKWYRIAAMNAYADAQVTLVESYLFGKIIKQNTEEAYLWCILAINNGKDHVREMLPKFEKNLSRKSILSIQNKALALSKQIRINHEKAIANNNKEQSKWQAFMEKESAKSDK